MLHLESIRSEIIDGQKLYFLSEGDWLEVILTGRVHGISLSKSLLARLEKIDLPVSIKHPEIITVGGLGGHKPFFYIYTLLKIDETYQRVRVHNLTCPNCNWEGHFADPFEAEIYLGTPKDVPIYELMRRTNYLLKETCPNCESNIKRKGIWFSEKP